MIPASIRKEMDLASVLIVTLVGAVTLLSGSPWDGGSGLRLCVFCDDNSLKQAVIG
jgi:hypothetical protein